jgi:dTDP-4-amino-4,6-dideoxygalactose transaminase
VSREFEEKFAAFVGVRHAIAVSSATMGALLIFDALGVDRRWTLLTSPLTFSGPSMMAHRLGAKIAMIDVGAGEFNVSPGKLRSWLDRAGGENTVVMPTHFGGVSADMAAIVRDAERAGALVVDDAAHALPTRDGAGRLVGAQGAKATFFSFYATKTVTTGEGGMVVTNDDGLASELRRRRLHGFSRDAFDRYTDPRAGWAYDVASPGWKANLVDTAAAMGFVQLDRAEEMRVARAVIAARYSEAFRGIRGVCTPPDDSGSSWHLYPLLVDERDAFVSALLERGVHCSVHFTPLYRHSYWARETLWRDRHLPNAEWLFQREVSLPIWSAMTREDVDHVIASVLDVVGVSPC